jgi:predicted aconitase
LADRNGLTEIIQKAGAQIFTDACPLVCKGSFPNDVQVVATDAAKQAHYTPGVAGFDVWYGTMDECIDCALTGEWRGELK